MTSADGTPDPGDPTATDEEAYEAELAEDDPVAPEAAIVTDAVTGVHTDEVQEAVDDETAGGESQ